MADPDMSSTRVEATLPGDEGSAGRVASGLPRTFGRYEVLGVIGAGACGTVLHARDPDLDRDVAIKYLHPETVTESRAERIRAEAIALAQLSHPHVVPIYDVGLLDGASYIVMQRVEGSTLRAWMQDPRTLDEVLDVFVGIAAGLQAAHAIGLVHRDLKPDNVLIDRSGSPLVVDFGLVRGLTRDDADAPPPTEASGLRASSLSSVADRLTATGALVGTPAYMAPEQFFGAEVTAAADQFAFCVTLFEALEGRPVFDTAGLTSLIEQVTGADRAGIGRNARIPSRVMDVLRRGLAVRPSQRFGSMGELAQALHVARRPRWYRAGGLAALGLATTVGLSWGIGAARNATEDEPAAFDGGPLGVPAAFARAVASAEANASEGRPDHAMEAAAQALRSATREELRARAMLLQARAAIAMERFEEGRTLALDALALAESNGDATSIALAALTAFEATPSITESPPGRAELLQRAEIFHLRSDRPEALAGRLAIARTLEALRDARAEEAQRIATDALRTETDPEIRARLLWHRGSAHDAADTPGALADLESAVEEARRVFPSRHPLVLEIRADLAFLVAGSGDWNRALGLLLELQSDHQALTWATPRARQEIAFIRAYCWYQAGEYERASAAIDPVVAGLGDDAWTQVELGPAAIKLQLVIAMHLRDQAALGMAMRSADALVASLGANRLATRQVRQLLGRAYLRAGEYARAEVLLRELYAQRDPGLNQAELELDLAQLAAARGDLDEAVPLAERAVATLQAKHHVPGYAAIARGTYAAMLAEAGRREEAEAEFLAAHAGLDASGPAWWLQRKELRSAAKAAGVALPPWSDGVE